MRVIGGSCGGCEDVQVASKTKRTYLRGSKKSSSWARAGQQRHATAQTSQARCLPALSNRLHERAQLRHEMCSYTRLLRHPEITATIAAALEDGGHRGPVVPGAASRSLLLASRMYAVRPAHEWQQVQQQHHHLEVSWDEPAFVPGPHVLELGALIEAKLAAHRAHKADSAPVLRGGWELIPVWTGRSPTAVTLPAEPWPALVPSTTHNAAALAYVNAGKGAEAAAAAAPATTMAAEMRNSVLLAPGQASADSAAEDGSRNMTVRQDDCVGAYEEQEDVECAWEHLSSAPPSAAPSVVLSGDSDEEQGGAKDSAADETDDEEEGFVLL